MIYLQLFGGGKGSTSTTTYTSRPLTEDEQRMEKSYADYAEAIQPSAYHLYNTATDRLTAADNVNPNYNSLYGQQANSTANLTNNFNNLSGNLSNQQSALNSQVSNVNNQLTNGTIPAAVQQARQNTVNNMAQTGLGNLLESKNANGVINSSVMNSGLNSLSNSVAGAINDSYSSDLAQYQSALQNTLKNTSDNMQQQYNLGTGLLSQGLNLANQPIAQANQAQQASYQLPLQLYGAATGQMSPTANIYNQATASQNQNGTQTTSTSGGGGGLFGSILGIGLGNSSFGKNW